MRLDSGLDVNRVVEYHSGFCGSEWFYSLWILTWMCRSFAIVLSCREVTWCRIVQPAP